MIERNHKVMSSAQPQNYETILHIVRAWSPAQRFSLVQDVLQTLAPAATTPPTQPTLTRALGLLTTHHAPPTDAQIARMIAERRDEQYEL